MKSLTVLIALTSVIAFLSSECLAATNDRPIIAVMAQMHPIDGSHHSYIAASYVKYLESVGARVVPIPHYFSSTTVKRIFRYVNGALFPGGNAYWFTSKYYRNAKIFWDLAIEANNRGDYFPIWGTCFGFQTMHTILVDKRCRAQRPAQDEATYLNFVDGARNSRMFKGMSDDLFSALENEDVTFNRHSYGLTQKTYRLNSELHTFFKILSLNNDFNGDEYISTVEAYNYPFYGTQWHPEKPPFEFSRHYKHIPHTPNAIRVSQYLANFFVNEARKNFHRFPSTTTERKYLIYSYDPYYSAGKFKESALRYFEQVYLFHPPK